MSKVTQVSALVACLLVAAGRADAQSSLPGDGMSALPSVVRVGVVDDEQHRFTLSTGIGYGYTEGVISGDDGHHRVPMALSVSYAPLSWLAFGYTQDIRYDVHVGEPDDGDSGWIFEPRIRLRGGWCSERGLRLGAEVMVWLPASDSQSSLAAGASVDMTLLAAFAPERWPFVLAAHAGFRLDRSAEGSTNADALSLSDRLSLGVSHSNAVLLGLALAWRVGPVELLGEWTWDLLVGDDAPDLGQTPMRVSAGARWWPSERWQVWLLVDVASLGRPSLERGAPLVVVEPRVTLTLGASFRIGFARDGEEPEIEAPAQTVRGRVVSSQGLGLAGARVTLSGADGERFVATDARGDFELETPGRGELTLAAMAEGYQDHRETVFVGEAPLDPLSIALESSRGGLGGQVRSSEGAPLRRAQVRITAGGETRELETDDQGRFAIDDIPAGEATVTVELYAYVEATAQTRVEGGRVSNVDLELERAFPAGQLSGIVRAPSGAPLEASIRIEPLGLDRATTSEGRFEIDVPPGRYRVTISAEAHASQRRTIVIEENGVTVLNIDLRPERRRNRR